MVWEKLTLASFCFEASSRELAPAPMRKRKRKVREGVGGRAISNRNRSQPVDIEDRGNRQDDHQHQLESV